MGRKNIKLLITTIVLIIVLVSGGLAGCSSTSEAENPTVTPSEISTSTPTETESTTADSGWTAPPISEQSRELPSIADVVAQVKPSVVSISTEVIARDFFNRQFTQEGAGSGWIIDENGVIVTNNHVIEGANAITVTTDDGTTYSADIDTLATDPLNDLAILKINATGLPALQRGCATDLRVGDWVIAIGNALGQGIRATEGIVSRKNVSLSVDQGLTLYDLLETSAAINPGNSGGPLVNLNGQVVGITSAKIAQVGVEGMGYAISIDTACPIIEELVNNGYVVRPWIGVGLYTVDQIAIRQLRLSVDTGVVLLQVVENGPAAEAGLQQRDVILKINDSEVADVEEFTRVLHSVEIGKPIEITYWRDDKEYTTTVIPVESPPPP